MSRPLVSTQSRGRITRQIYETHVWSGTRRGVQIDLKYTPPGGKLGRYAKRVEWSFKIGKDGETITGAAYDVHAALSDIDHAVKQKALGAYQDARSEDATA
jgi:hypothetical protein